MKNEQVRLPMTGILFLAAFFAYGIGSGIVTGIIESTNPVVELIASKRSFIVGVCSMLANSAIVLGIGWRLFPILLRTNRIVAWLYLATRGLEASALAVGSIGLLLLVTGEKTASQDAIMAASRCNFFAYQIGMACLGFGSIFFCRLLFRHRMVPRFLAVWGGVGYMVFFVGAILELMGRSCGTLLSIPGGLFEVAFAFWLIVKGLDQPFTVPS